MKKDRSAEIMINVVLALVCLIWTIPTIGLLVSSFRTPEDIAQSGWWTVFPHQDWVKVSTVEDIPRDFDNDIPFAIPALGEEKFLFAEWRQGVTVNDKHARWVGNKRLGLVEIQEKQWVGFSTNFTMQNYENVLTGKTYEIPQSDGSVVRKQGAGLGGAFLNSLAVSIPATVIPILIAAFAAYGFAWMKFAGQKLMFILVIALLVVPLQIALVPIMNTYNFLGINGSFLAIWLAHTGFGLPLATYLLYNYISSLPRETLESAFIDGASHFTVFTRLVLPLSVPALASFAIFQFLWVWNDYLVALIYVGSKASTKILTIQLAEMVGSRGNDWHLLTAGAFVTMLLPLIVFFSLQRYFVRGLLAGSVKG